MSEKEFESYLTLLGSMLKLSKGQRADISQELRDYLEDRFDELIEAGYSAQEARTKALEELGDAASVANLFQLVSHQSQRRWMMKYASVSIFGCFLLLVMFGSMWPDSSNIKPLAPTVAQDKESPDPPPKPATKKPTPKTKVVKKPKPVLITKHSVKPLRFSKIEQATLEHVFHSEDNFTANDITEAKLRNFKVSGTSTKEITLSDFLAYLKSEYKIQAVLLKSITEDSGVDPETTEVKLIQGMRLYQSFILVIHELSVDEKICFSIVDGVIYLGTQDDALISQVRVYDLENLIENTGIDEKELEDTYVSMIQKGAEPESDYSLKWVGQKLTIRQMGSKHMETQKLLRQLYPEYQKEKRQILENKLKIDYLKKFRR